MKKGLSIFLAFIFVVGIYTSAPITANAASVSDLTFELNADGTTYKVTGYNQDASGELVIPSTYNGLPVTSIGDDAFEDCTSLTSITIPDSVTSIGYEAFRGCSPLTSITIPDSVTSIGYGAFYNCSSLKSITIPDSVTSIAGSVFTGCTSLTSVTIPDSVTSIGTSAFWGCESLTSITIPRTITSIDTSAFNYCSSLTSVYITDLASWCNVDFDVYSSNPLYFAKKLYLNGELVTDLIIPDSVTEIKDHAFENCTSLTSITIPDSVTSIGDSAFEYCTSLTSVHITSLASWCNIDFDSYPNPLWYAENLYLNGELVTELTIPENITEIKRYAFWGCTSLTSITIPDSVTSIGDFAFYGCSSITSITIPDSITSISSGAFASCESLTSVTIPDSVTSIGGEAFSYCESLTSITIPDSVTSIGLRAFYRCKDLTSVTIPKSVTSVGNDAFKLCDSLLIIRVYSNSAGLTYVENSNINYTILDESVSEDNLVFTLNSDGKSYSVTGFINEIRSATLEIPASLNGLPVTSIGEYAFRHCTSLTSVIIPDTVTNIGEKAFYNCILLENIIISDYVKNIGSAAFCETAYFNNSNNWENDVLYINNYLLNIKDTLSGDYIIKDGTTCIADSAFIYCYDLTSVTIPETVTNIGKNAFYKCNSLTQVNISDIASWSNISFGDALSNPLYYAKKLYLNGELVTDLIIPKGVRKINDFAFYNCTPLTSVIIPDGVTSIGNSAFEGCSALTKVRIPDNVTSIGNKTFYNCYSLKNVTIPDGVTSIGDMPFSGCSSLTSVIIPDSVTSVGIFNFNGCRSLTSIVIPDSVTSIPDAAFKNCTSLTSVTIPGGVTNICDEAFDECSSLRYVFFAGSSEDWDKIIKGVYNTKLYSVKMHYNATDHSHSVVKNLPSSEGMQGSIEDICPVCGFVNSSKTLVYVNNYITAVDTKNVVIDASAAILTLDISASKDLSEAIVVMDGYTLKVIPNSDNGFLGTGSKVQIIDSTGNVVAEYTLVVRGDVNGDSVCDVLDCMLIELAQTHNTTLDGVYLAAGDLAENGEITVEDFSAVVNKALNKA